MAVTGKVVKPTRRLANLKRKIINGDQNQAITAAPKTVNKAIMLN
jgi:HAMP domain-containing protein